MAGPWPPAAPSRCSRLPRRRSRCGRLPVARGRRLGPVRQPRDGGAARPTPSARSSPSASRTSRARAQADLLAARPLIESGDAAVVGGRAFTGAVPGGRARRAPRPVRPGPGHVVLTVADVGTVLAAAVRVVRPSLARRSARAEDVARRASCVEASAAAWTPRSHASRLLTVLLGLLALACAGGRCGRARPARGRRGARHGRGGRGRRARALLRGRAGRALAAAGSTTPTRGAAAGAVLDAFLGDLRTAAWMLAGSRRGRGRRGRVADPAGRDRRAAAARRARDRRRAGPPALRALRGGALVAAGVSPARSPASRHRARRRAPPASTSSTRA